MPLFSDSFTEHDWMDKDTIEALDHIESCYRYVTENAVQKIEYGDPDLISEAERAESNLRVLQQAHFHQVRSIFAELEHLAVAGNTYLLSLGARSLYETAGTAGYVCRRLTSLDNGNISYDRFILDIADTLMAARHEVFQKAPDPVNVLSTIDAADVYLDRYFFGQKKGILRDCYDWLSEYTHPNFLSNTAAFHLNPETNDIHIGRGIDEALTRRQLIGYVSLFAGPFEFLQEEITRHLKVRTIHTYD